MSGISTHAGQRGAPPRPTSASGGYLNQDVEVACAGTPGGDFHLAQRERIDLYWERSGLLVGPPFDQYARV
jgi:hypothetical protein